MRVHRLVLLALLVPIVGVVVVLWFLLPGSIAGLTYTPSQFSREAQLQPTYWTSHQATVRGYLTRIPSCKEGPCRIWLLSDTPGLDRAKWRAMDPTVGVLVTTQHESAWHDLLRRLTPGLLARPFPGSAHTGLRIAVTGALQAAYSDNGPPILVPASL